jgi:hypothetical protein
MNIVAKGMINWLRKRRLSRERNFDFHPRDRDIHIYIFSHFRTIKFILFNCRFGMTMTRDDAKNIEL